MLPTKSEILDSIYDNLNEDDLRDINSACCDRLKEIRDRQCRRAKDNYRIGMEIRFRGNNRSPGPHTGIIERKNAKTMKVNVGYTTWTIPYASDDIKILKA